jgi:glycosyltransferase involved in cell wall biosynthesis
VSFVFVTTELAPLTPGGAGVVVAGLAERLRADGDDVRIVVVRDADAPPLAASGDVRVVVVDPQVDGPDTDARARFLARARAAARAVADEVRGLEHAVVEFVDFDGLGYWAVTHREELGLGRVPLTVRFHGPVDLMWEATGHGHAEWETVREMERASFALADRVLVPTGGHAPVVAQRYGVPAERITVAPPPVPELERVDRPTHTEPILTVVGRLGEVKGSPEMIDAALQILPGHPTLTIRFVGDDGWSAAEGRPMRQTLTARIPPELADRIVFTGPLERAEVAAELAIAWGVVAPSRFESFCLAAHEARRAGLPVVVPDLPAFADLFDESTGAIVYDGTVPGLVAAMRRLLTDQALRDRLAGRAATAHGR